MICYEQGNSAGNKVRTNTYSYGSVTCFIRPDFKADTPSVPEAPRISASVNNGKVTFSWSKYSGSFQYYWLRVYKDKIWNSDGYKAKSSGTSTSCTMNLGNGHYVAYIDVYDTNEKILAYGYNHPIEFDVSLKTTRTSRNNNIVFYSWSQHAGATDYTLRAKKVENGQWVDDGRSVWNIKETNSFLVLTEGKYVVYVDANTADGACQYTTDTVDIVCGDPKLSSYVSGNTVNFKWSAYSGATYYTLRIYKNRIWTDFVDSVEKTTSLSKGLTLSKGDYAAFVEAYNSSGKSLQYSNAITFSVTKDLPSTCTHSYSSKITKSATCTTTGIKTFTCSKCGNQYTQTIAALGHDYLGSVTKAATCTEKGVKTFKCSRCTSNYTQDIAALGHDIKTKVGEYAKVYQTGSSSGYTVDYCTRCDYQKINHSAFMCVDSIYIRPINTYTGKVITPSIRVALLEGGDLKEGKDYTLKYATGRKNIGKYAVKVTFKGNYQGSRTVYFKIVPKGTTLSKLTAGKKAFTAKWKKLGGITGYQIQYCTNAYFTGAKTVTVKGATAASKTIKNLKAKQVYYVRIRTYKTISKANYFSTWSKTYKVKTK